MTDGTILLSSNVTTHRRRFFVDLANSEGAKLFYEVCLNLIILFQCGILPPNSSEDKKKVFAAFWFYLSP